jgi:hypothetical protein
MAVSLKKAARKASGLDDELNASIDEDFSDEEAAYRRRAEALVAETERQAQARADATKREMDEAGTKSKRRGKSVPPTSRDGVFSPAAGNGTMTLGGALTDPDREDPKKRHHDTNVSIGQIQRRPSNRVGGGYFSGGRPPLTVPRARTLFREIGARNFFSRARSPPWPHWRRSTITDALSRPARDRSAEGPFERGLRMRGRKPKTARAKKLAGNPGKRPLKKPGVVAPDRELVEQRLEFWLRQVRRAEKMVQDSPCATSLALAEKASRQLRGWLDERRRLELKPGQGEDDELGQFLGTS